VPTLSIVFLAVVFALCLASVPLTRGRLSRLGDVQFRATWLIGAAIVLQILIISVVPGGDGALHQVVHLSTYALAGAFVVANRRIPGLLIAAAGGAMNFAAIAANGGVMPAEPRALELAGIEQDPTTFENSTALAHAKLQFLGDIFAVPGYNVFSVGDLVLIAGVLVGLHVICRRTSVHPIS
jgi:hypothetical protein